MNWLAELLPVVAVFGVALLLTGVIRRMALHRNLLDIPNHRSSHALPVPRGGGGAIVVAFVLGLTGFFVLGWISGRQLAALVGGGLLVAAIGFADDCRHVPARWRLLVHFLAVGFGVYCQGGPALFGGYGWFGYAGTVVALVWLLNLFNFMDGIDGLAAMEASVVAGGAALLLLLNNGSGDDARVLGIFCAACAGFLVWNWPPAKIFMGDVGSGFLGYMLGMLAVGSFGSGVLSPWVWLILAAFFCIDATVTLVSRMIAGEPWREAHCSHAYQYAARRCRSHRTVTLGALAVNVFWLLPLAGWAMVRPDFGWLLAVGAVLPLMVWVVRERVLGRKQG